MLLVGGLSIDSFYETESYLHKYGTAVYIYASYVWNYLVM